MTGSDVTGPDDDPWEVLTRAAREAEAQERAREANGYPVAAKVKLNGKRERIVLAKRSSGRRVVRTLAELEDQTRVGEVLVSQLVRVQLILSIRLMLLTVVVLAGIPLMFLMTSMGSVNILGLRLPWLLLGFVVYPFFVAVAWSYNRSADRNEQAFADMVEN
ncbi:MAG: hypothetical protein M3Y48_06385 [Actinomycetota bacterium]|nr:hypothetical protein [Actinomycetota bacterium]